MKIALITDQHFGIRNDNISFIDYYDRFYSNIFFPYLEKNNINTIFMLGDTFDRRKYTNHNIAYLSKKIYFDKLKGYDVHAIVGNHDTFFKNSNEVNSPELLLNDYKNITIYKDPKEVEFDNTLIAVLPWVCSGNYSECMSFMENTKAQILFGHLEIAGFEMHRGAVTDHGFDMGLFSKFDMVMSGHFHHKSSRGNIYYLGAPYEMTWSDFEDPRGFHIFDTDDRSLKYIQNPYRMFNKIFYDDSNKELEELLAVDEEFYKGSYIKVVVKNKTNPYWFDLFIDRLEKIGVLDLKITEDNISLNLDDGELLEEAENTLTILKKSVDSVESNVDKKELDKFLTSLYNEALHME